jgi:hypothetical protein
MEGRYRKATDIVRWTFRNDLHPARPRTEANTKFSTKSRSSQSSIPGRMHENTALCIYVQRSQSASRDANETPRNTHSPSPARTKRHTRATASTPPSLPVCPAPAQSPFRALPACPVQHSLCPPVWEAALPPPLLPLVLVLVFESARAGEVVHRLDALLGLSTRRGWRRCGISTAASGVSFCTTITKG